MLAREARASFRELSSLISVSLILSDFLCGILAFNLDLENPAVYSGPAGSYFGYSVDFYQPTQYRSA